MPVTVSDWVRVCPTVKVSRRELSRFPEEIGWYAAEVAQGSRSLLASSVPCLTGPMERSSTGYFEVHWIGGRSEMWSFRLNREDGKTVMASYSYDSQEEMEEAIAWIRANVGRVGVPRAEGRPPRPPANRRRPRPPLPDRWWFSLADDNGKVVLMSRPCDTEQEAEAAMAWVKAVAPHAEVRIENPPTPEYETWRRRPRELT
jgi:uncharacterized protein YegP (UPF0339 family)